MDKWFDKLTDASALASNELALKEALSSLTKELGFDCYAYLNLNPRDSFAVSNYPNEWQERYFDRSYSLIDPVVTVAKRKMCAFSWSAQTGKSLSKEVRAFYADADDFGIRSGISIPVKIGFGNVAMLTLAGSSDVARTTAELDPILAAASVAQVHGKFTRQSASTTIAEDVAKLKPQERVCLKWAAEGKTFEDIAELEGMKYHNVCFHIKEARKKLDVISLPQATALATKLDLI